MYKTDYDLLNRQAESLIKDVPYLISNLANISALIYETLEDINWAGFYLAEGDKLYLGPFQGKTACVEIPFGRGVCGTAATENKTQLVADVHKFPGHIACDSASQSEIVVPVNHGGRVIGVMPDIIAAKGQIYPHLSELIRTETMAERKAAMNRLGEAYIALPGGPGTLEEIAEVMSQARLQVHSHPCIFLGVNGYHEPMKQYVDTMIREGFWKPEEAEHIFFTESVQEAAEIIEQ